MTNTANRLRTVGVIVLFGLIAIACSGATEAEVAVAPDIAVPAQVDQVDSTQQDEPETERVEATTTTAVDTTTEAPPAAETTTELDPPPEENDEEDSAVEEPTDAAATPEVTSPSTTSTSSTTTSTTASTTTTSSTTTEAPAEVSPLFQGDFVDLNGQSIALADFEGEDVVLWFWAPW